MQLDRRVLAGDRDDAGLRGQLEHLQPVELAAGGHVHSADHEGALPDRKRPQHLQAHRGADEPRRGQLDGRPNVLEPEPLRHRGSQRAVVDPQHHRNIGPDDLGHHPGPQHLAQHDPGLDVDHVVLGQHRHRAGVVDAGRFQRLAQRRIAEDHRHLEFGRRRQEAVVLVALDHRDVVSGGGQVS